MSDPSHDGPLPVTLALDKLFAVTLSEFVKERKAIAASFKAAGDAKTAKEIEKTPRPTVSAWIVNQLARREAPLLKTLVEITSRLKRLQTKGPWEGPLNPPRDGADGPSPPAPTRPQGQAAAVGAADDYAAVLAAHRDTLNRLRARGEEILAASGQIVRPPILDRVVRNLRVGVVGDDTRSTVERGRLVTDVAEADLLSLLGEPSEGFAAGPAATTHAAPPKRFDVGTSARATEPKLAHAPAHANQIEPPKRDRRAEQIAAREAATRATEAARARARAEAEQARARSEAQRRIRILQAEADSARRAFESAQARAEAARQALAEAEARLQTARDELERSGAS